MELTKEIIGKISEEYGDSFYVLDTEQFKSNFLELQEAFRNKYANTFISYSYKTNYIPRLCKLVDELGGYAEVVSDMESKIALTLGVNPEKIIFNGPYKNPIAVRELLISGATINIDSLFDLEIIKNIAKEKMDQKFSAVIRCNFPVEDNGISRFGFDVTSNDFMAALTMFEEVPNLNLKGFHCHFANRSIASWSSRTKGMLEVLKKHYKGTPEYISLGGGLYGKMADSLKSQFDCQIPTYEEYAEVVATQVFEAYGKLPYEKQPKLFIEPGSALVGDAMKFVAKVISIKNVSGKNIATVLGSIYNINPTLNKKNPPIEIFNTNENDAKNYQDLDFGGFTCIESDYLYRGLSGDLAVGDYVVFGNIGSYSIVLKPPFILPNFAIVECMDNGRISLIKEAEKFDDLFHTFVFS